MYSALKRGGVPLYRLARSRCRGRARAAPRAHRGARLIERYGWPELELARALLEGHLRPDARRGHRATPPGRSATCARLRRLTVSPFAEQGMRTFAELEAAAAAGVEALDRLLLPAEAALTGWPSAHLAPAEVARLAHGQAVPADPALPCGHVKIYAARGSSSPSAS